MKKSILMFLIAMMPVTSTFAVDGDLVLPGAKWVAKFDKYVCAAFGPGVSRPYAFAQLNTEFERIVTDSTLDNALLTANFSQNGTACRYSAILFADNAAATVRLVQSKAFALNRGGDCSKGKAVIDLGLRATHYLYYGHPHNLAIMMPVQGATQVCGGNVSTIGVNFVVSGKLPPQGI